MTYQTILIYVLKIAFIVFIYYYTFGIKNVRDIGIISLLSKYTTKLIIYSLALIVISLIIIMDMLIPELMNDMVNKFIKYLNNNNNNLIERILVRMNH